jgi:hypothetical protein
MTGPLHILRFQWPCNFPTQIATGTFLYVDTSDNKNVNMWRFNKVLKLTLLQRFFTLLQN